MQVPVNMAVNSASTKASIREMIWNYLEEHDIADFPRPVHHRIPNFKGAPAACNRLSSMDVFKKARTIKVNPDKPQQQARFMILEVNMFSPRKGNSPLPDIFVNSVNAHKLRKQNSES